VLRRAVRTTARLLRAPAVHFLAIGCVLHAVSAAIAPPGAPRPAVRLTATDRERLRDEWTREHGAPPDARAEAVLVARAVDEEILYREALAAGLAERDPIVRARLERLGRFVVGDALEDPAAIDADVRRLGLARADVVVRRHLIALMRLALARPGPGDAPTDDDLAAYLARHAERFAAPARVTLTHVYLARERHGTALAGDAARLLRTLAASAETPDAAPARGDPFLRGPAVVGASAADLERTFGPEFARAVADAPLGRWSGPFASAYGLHLVWVHDRAPGGVPPLAAVRGRVLEAVRAERGTDRLASRLAVLRARYDVDVADR
jgi:peptidyl-prolyl cis-trans isomerase C